MLSTKEQKLAYDAILFCWLNIKRNCALSKTLEIGVGKTLAFSLREMKVLHESCKRIQRGSIHSKDEEVDLRVGNLSFSTAGLGHADRKSQIRLGV